MYMHLHPKPSLHEQVALCDVLGVGPSGRVTISQVKMAEGHSRRESSVIILGANKVGRYNTVGST